MFPKIHMLHPVKKRIVFPKEIGIEIEMEGRDLLLPENRIWRMTGDGSLRGNESIEYILITPCKLEEVDERITTLLKLIKPARLQPSDRCGVHIHINVQDMVFTECFNFIFLYLMFEKVLVGYCGESREGNLYCLRATDAEHFIDRMIVCKRQSNLEELGPFQGISLRYASINPEAIFKFGSVEFRALKTPKDLLKISEWVNILHQVKVSSLKFEEPLNFIEHYSMRGEDRFLNDIMGPYAPLLRKTVEEVDQKLLDGVRLMQDVAYTPTVVYPVTSSSKKGKKRSWGEIYTATFYIYTFLLVMPESCIKNLLNRPPSSVSGISNF